MTITYRFYEQLEDLQAQYAFWEKITRDLPYAWKLTTSPGEFNKQEEFSPKSRYFAFDRDTLVGYMSFTGSGGMVSLGYPWVLRGYEGEVQEELFNKVYNFAASEEYGANMMVQRFRKQWDNQIQFFLDKGFTIASRSPIIGKTLSQEDGFQSLLPYEVGSSFSFEAWKSLIQNNGDITTEEVDMMETYFRSIQFDFSVVYKEENKTIAYAGVTIRPDTKYSEVIALAIHSDYTKELKNVMRAIEEETKKRNVQTLSIAEGNLPEQAELHELGYKPLTEDVFVMKELK
ncbi:hypothetical protein [Pontibacillus sp. HMF3514]|uniref:hypothetical protein n=1 Tax=Pontibacillus sp. HMF3514 TaxID=2692425 RepID=UPI0013201E16|nr:hypothetical protein [Pontibacillus sp. HMF3514]QHE53969.1 hypothetical protein GS400_18930 [Pontibacillus sp. HMF3514]